MLHLHAAARIEPLAARLAEVCSTTPVNPMEPEWIAVPTDGMRRWLTLDLAHRLGTSGPGSSDGISANITSAYAGSLRLSVLETGRRPEDPDPWRVERLAWAILDVAERASADPALAALVELPPGGSRYGRVRRVAQLFDRYHLQRPDMIRAWALGHDVDGTGRPLAPHHLWQPYLWRLVRERLGVASQPERLPGLLEQLHAGTLDVDLPERLLMFGLTVPPGGPDFLDLARAVGDSRDLHLFFLEPSPVVAERLATKWPSRSAGGPRFRSEDDTADLVSHPLLRSWGRLHRETAVLLLDAERDGMPAAERVPDPARRGRAAAAGSTLLGRLQADLRADAEPAADLSLSPTDQSVQFHACHGPTRQVEVLRDALLHALADPELALTEDQILVVCPALERFAPTIEAVFGPSVDAPGAHLPSSVTGKWSPSVDPALAADQAPAVRYRIADRSISNANPVLTATTALLELVSGRFEAPAVLDFVSLAPVRTRYRFSDDDVARLSEWVGETHVRWGLDAEHREAFGVPPIIADNTWRAATDRLLMGAAVYDDDRSLAAGDVVPYGVESDDVVIAGKLSELMWRLGELADQAAVARPIGQWVELLRDAAHTLFSTPRDAEWQFEALLRMLGDINELSTSSTDGPSDTPLEFVDVRRLVNERIGSTPGRPDFFRGGITISSMTPLRWVPYRVVALLGMDQSAFSAGAVDGDDLCASNPLLGDRDARGEARQALLETVLAARDRLVLVRDGHDVRTNHEVPPAVAVAELRDVLLAMVQTDARDAFAARLEVHHPRQPFDERNFIPDALLATGPWGFDGAALAGARARRERATAMAPFLAGPFPRDDSQVIELASLHDFLKHPIKYFLRQQLGLRLPRKEDGASALLPVGVEGLDKYKIGDRLLSAMLDGSTVEEWARIEKRRGTLPPGAIGGALIKEISATVELLVGTAQQRGLRSGPALGLPVDVQLSDGTRVVGSVLSRLHEATPGPARVAYSSAKPEYRIAAWLDLMALIGTDPQVDWHAVGVNKLSGSGPVKLEVIDLEATADVDDRQHAAVRALEVAVDCFRRGSQEPIPLFPKLSPNVHIDEAKPDHWSNMKGFGDGDDVGTSLVYGDHDFESVLAIKAVDGDPGDPGSSASRVERFARHLWNAIDGSVTDRADPAGAPDGVSVGAGTHAERGDVAV